MIRSYKLNWLSDIRATTVIWCFFCFFALFTPHHVHVKTKQNALLAQREFYVCTPTFLYEYVHFQRLLRLSLVVFARVSPVSKN